MDEAFESVNTQLQRLKGKRTMDEYLKVWSKTVENTMLTHMQIEEEVAKNMRGRGQVNIKKVTPQKPSEEGKVKHLMMYKANGDLKQARRCESKKGGRRREEGIQGKDKS